MGCRARTRAERRGAVPYRRKDSPVWWVSITGPDGKRARRSTGTTDRREAEALEAKAEEAAAEAAPVAEEPAAEAAETPAAE